MENQISPSLDEELPEEVRSGLQGLMPPGTRLQLSVSSDIKLDGEYWPAWLVATEERLIAFSPDGGERPISSISPLQFMFGKPLGTISISR